MGALQLPSLTIASFSSGPRIEQLAIEEGLDHVRHWYEKDKFVPVSPSMVSNINETGAGK